MKEAKDILKTINSLSIQFDKIEREKAAEMASLFEKFFPGIGKKMREEGLPSKAICGSEAFPIMKVLRPTIQVFENHFMDSLQVIMVWGSDIEICFSDENAE